MRAGLQTSGSKESEHQSFIKMPSGLTGQQLFAEEHKDKINEEATKCCKDAKDGCGYVSFYQTVLKEMWRDVED